MSSTNISTRDGWRGRRRKKWLVKSISSQSQSSHFWTSHSLSEYEPDELNPSLYSFHSNIDEKNKLLYTFSQQGIETVVDRVAKKNRIKDWIQSSVITEEDEMEVSAAEGSNRYLITAFW